MMTAAQYYLLAAAFFSFAMGFMIGAGLAVWFCWAKIADQQEIIDGWEATRWRYPDRP